MTNHPARYMVEVLDSAGPYSSARAISWTDCLRIVRQFRECCPGKHLAAVNINNVDLGCADGLTDEEREEFNALP